MSELSDSLQGIRNFFDSGATLSYAFRKKQLELLARAVRQYEKSISKALYEDLRKNPAEVWISETGLLLSEIHSAIRNLHRWMRPKRVASPLTAFGASSRIHQSPLGVVLIISPWNYPLQLLLNPLVGAIAAGNAAVLKPSELAPATEKVIAQMIAEIYPRDYIRVVHGIGADVVPQIIQEFSFDHIFFTGGTATGRAVYQLAAGKLIPVTLELGGKSPCIVYKDADIKTAARRIVSTKFINAGQTCIAPDYILVDQDVRNALLEELKKTMITFYGENPVHSNDYGRIIDSNHFMRLVSLLKPSQIYYGGSYDASSLYIAPTLLNGVSMEDPVMQEEIFGPLLPVISFGNTSEAMASVGLHDHPLALYLFTKNQQLQSQWMDKVPFGGGCINDAAIQFMNKKLPFGGVGSSGIGAYHGKKTFQLFSHEKPVMRASTLIDPPLRYPPWNKKLKWLKRILR